MKLIEAGYKDDQGVYHALTVRTGVEDPRQDVIKAARLHAAAQGREVKEVVGYLLERVILWEAQRKS